MFLFLGIILFIAFYIHAPSQTGKSIEDFSITNNTDIESIDNIKIYDEFPNIDKTHFSKMPITYSYGKNCVGPIIPRLEWALKIIENETNGLVYFERSNKDAKINFVCYDNQNTEAIYEGWYTYGTEYTYGQSTIEELSGQIIEKTKIEFWSVKKNTRPPSCINFPNLEIHEIMHSFGFDHINDNKYSLMYPEVWKECKSKNETITLHTTGETFIPKDEIDKEIIECLKYIYSNGKQGKCSTKVKFLYELEDYECPDGWYESLNEKDGCCPEPNMIIDDENYCDYY